MNVFRVVTNLFIPHEENDHKPHFLRSDSVQTILIFALIAQMFYLSYAFIIAPGSNQVAAVIASTLIDQTNKERSISGLNNLSTNALLQKSAQLKADHMATYGYFSHNSPDGTTPWYWFKQAGYPYQSAGENLAVNFIESRDVTQAWMNSPTHRENILNGRFSEIGIATAIGKYKGRDAIFVVQHFGRQQVVAARPTTPPVNTPIEITPVGVQAKNTVLGATTETRRPTFVEVLITFLPKISLSVHYAILIISIVALLLASLIRIRKQHPVLIANGFMLIAITVGIVFMNTLIAQGSI